MGVVTRRAAQRESSRNRFQAEHRVEHPAEFTESELPFQDSQYDDRHISPKLDRAASAGEEVQVKLLSPHLSRVVSQQQAPDDTAPDDSVPDDTAQKPGQSPQAAPGIIKRAKATSSKRSTRHSNAGVASAEEVHLHSSVLDKESQPNHLQDEAPKGGSVQQPLWQQPKWPWLLLLSLTVLCWVVHKQHGSKHARFSGPQCNQLMRFQSLAPMLVHTDAKSYLAELWSGETRDPFKAGGVLLACPDTNVSSAAVTAVMSSLSPDCANCLHHFDMYQLAAVGEASQGPEQAGQAQKSLVALLQRCRHAVVVVEGIEAMPSALLSVFINLLSEHGHFEHDGSQVPAYKALVVATVTMPTGDLQKAAEQEVENSVKQHIVHKLIADGSSDDLLVTRAAALRRRFEHVALVQAHLKQL
ncbi:hypothetical protein ABBQ32_009052 [Trebouxia sp. C0010 RCD-2024]